MDPQKAFDKSTTSESDRTLLKIKFHGIDIDKWIDQRLTDKKQSNSERIGFTLELSYMASMWCHTRSILTIVDNFYCFKIPQ